MKSSKKKIAMGIFVSLLIGLVIGVSVMSYTYTPQFIDSNGNPIANSIASLEKVELGGIEQSILIRGEKTSNPVLLFLHGGPGSPDMGLIRHYNKELEKHFIVVTWDQRGAGKSYSSNIPDDTMNINQFVSDTNQLVQLLKKRFNKDKIYLLGHSWGSIIGLKTAHQYPENFYAYIGIGQVVNMKQQEQISYQFTLKEARKRNNTEAIQALEKIGYPENGRYKGGIDDVLIQKNWLLKLGGSFYEQTDYSLMTNAYMNITEVGLLDFLNFYRGFSYTPKIMWDDILRVDFPNEIKGMNIPVYFITGEKDFTTPVELIEKYATAIKAPTKEFIKLEKTGHFPQFEKPDEFNTIIINILKHHK